MEIILKMNFKVKNQLILHDNHNSSDSINSSSYWDNKGDAGEMVSHVRMFAALSKDLGSVASTHGQLTAAYHSNSRQSEVLFWPVWAAVFISTHEHTQTHTQ